MQFYYIPSFPQYFQIHPLFLSVLPHILFVSNQWSRDCAAIYCVPVATEWATNQSPFFQNSTNYFKQHVLSFYFNTLVEMIFKKKYCMFYILWLHNNINQAKGNISTNIFYKKYSKIQNYQVHMCPQIKNHIKLLFFYNVIIWICDVFLIIIPFIHTEVWLILSWMHGNSSRWRLYPLNVVWVYFYTSLSS